jgi:hypothetical protein
VSEFIPAGEVIRSVWFEGAGSSCNVIVCIDGKARHRYASPYPQVARVITWITPKPENCKWILGADRDKWRVFE